MHLLPLLLAPALAGDVFGTVQPEVRTGTGGNWARLHASDAGWWFFQSAGRDSWVEDLAPDLSGFDDQARVRLTQRANLQDIQVEPCADGGWLVAASATLDAFDDSAYAFRFGSDFAALEEGTLEEREPARAHNDMVVLCNDAATGVAYANGRGGGGGGGGSTFFDLDGVEVAGTTNLDWNAMGASMAVRPADGRIVGADIDGPESPRIRMTVFDDDWSVLERATFEVPSGAAFWPQRLLPFGDGWIVAYLARQPGAQGNDGEVWLAALDAEFGLVDSVQVSALAQNGRPWVARRGNVLAVSYDREVQPHATLVALAGDPPPEDTGTGGGSGSHGTSGDDAASAAGCACAAPGVGATRPSFFVVALLAGWMGRRRRTAV
jgi:hypothetical protein